MNPFLVTPDSLRELKHDTRYRHGAKHGYVCEPRLRILEDALEGAACLIEHKRRSRHIIIAIAWACAILATLSGVGIGALIFIP